MTRITVDTKLGQQLGAISSPVEFTDPSGTVIGVFYPKVSAAASIDVPYTPEEIDRRFQEKGGRTLDEIFADLENRS